MRHRGISMYSIEYRKYGLETFLIRSVSLCSKTETIRHRGLVVLLCTILLGRSSSTLNKFVYAAFCTCQSGDRSLSQLLHTGGGDSAVFDPRSVLAFLSVVDSTFQLRLFQIILLQTVPPHLDRRCQQFGSGVR